MDGVCNQPTPVSMIDIQSYSKLFVMRAMSCTSSNLRRYYPGMRYSRTVLDLENTLRTKISGLALTSNTPGLGLNLELPWL